MLRFAAIKNQTYTLTNETFRAETRLPDVPFDLLTFFIKLTFDPKNYDFRDLVFARYRRLFNSNNTYIRLNSSAKLLSYFFLLTVRF